MMIMIMMMMMMMMMIVLKKHDDDNNDDDDNDDDDDNSEPEHGSLGEDGLLPEVGLVGPHLVPGHHTDLVARGVELDLGAAPHDDEGVEEVGLDAAGGEAGVVGLQEDHADDVVADVTLPLQLLGVVLLIRQKGGDVEHDLRS